MQSIKVAVVGAGAIGGILAAFIRKQDIDVQLICRNADHARTIESEGLHVSGIRGDFTVNLPAAGSIEEMTPERDIVLLSVKATEMIDAATRLKPLLGEKTVVVSLQNGLCEETLAAILGRDRVIGCVTGWGATRHSPTRLEMTSLGEFVIGNIENRPDDRLEPIAEILGCVVPVHVSNNIMGSLYSKLIINACITSVGAVCGLYLGQMTRRKKVRQLFFTIMREALTVAENLGIRVEPYAGKLDYYPFLAGTSLKASLKRHLFIFLMGMKYRRLKSSSLQSLERGQKTEINYLTGFIADHGKQLGIPTPVNSAVLSMVKEIEDRARIISPDNLSELFTLL